MAIDVPAVTASVRIIEILASELPDPVQPGRLVQELNLNRSTCYNILATLQRAGWAKSLGNRRGWTLGPRLLTLTGVSQEMTLELVQQEIDALSRRLGFVVFVAEPVNAAGYTVTAKAEYVNGVRVSVSVGDYFPYGAPALMLASSVAMTDDDFRKQYARNGTVAFTDHTETDVEQILNRLVKVRDLGYSTSMQEFQDSQGAAAAPVFDPQGRVRMVVGTLAFYSELNEKAVTRVGPEVRACADRITSRTGGALPERVVA